MFSNKDMILILGSDWLCFRSLLYKLSKFNINEDEFNIYEDEFMLSKHVI
jgi:hypothetical protein